MLASSDGAPPAVACGSRPQGGSYATIETTIITFKDLKIIVNACLLLDSADLVLHNAGRNRMSFYVYKSRDVILTNISAQKPQI